LAGADKSGTAPNLLKTSGQAPLQLTLSNGAVYPQNGRMLFSDRQVDSQTGTIRIVSTFPNPGNVLRPGQFGRVRALVSLRKDALLVPQRAVSELQGRYQVAVVGPGNKISVRFVKVGDRVDDLWIVTDGLHPGENVVSEGVAKVRDGAVVNPKSDRSGVASTP
jgi:membrane fusion protein (multidrug efflux system)